MDENSWDVIVIGGGAAGLTAALTLGRARRRTLVIDAGSPRNRFAEHMYGFLGHDGLDPAKLLELGRAEAAGYGVEFLAGTVEKVQPDERGVGVQLAEGASLRGRQLIVATGLADRLPDVPGLAERWGTSVLHCPYCHGWEVRDKKLGVLITSPMGLHQAELIRQWSDQLVVFTAAIAPVPAEVEQRLTARGVRLVSSPVVEVVGEGTAISAVRTAAGEEVPIEAIFVAAASEPHDSFLQHLDLTRAENPMGSFIEVDPTGKTSAERIWAIGNVVNPAANVAVSVGAGSFTGAVVNMALVTEDFDDAVADSASWPEIAPVDYWENRYGGENHTWSGNPNSSMVHAAQELPRGRALDVGSGEGADAIWLARNGWRTTGVDISANAARKAGEAARAAGVGPETLDFVAADLSEWTSEERFDLITASFLHSPVSFSRQQVLQRLAGMIAPGGHLLIVTHADFPPWADQSMREQAARTMSRNGSAGPPAGHDGEQSGHQSGHQHGHGHGNHVFLSPEQEVEQLALDPAEWTVVRCETRAREATSPTGEQAMLDDGVVLMRRNG